ncbi:hypothetical protein GC173_13465 [bacterium]|nr:hypothetical protein [bacterium]
MSRVLIVGVGPMPSPNAERVHAPGLRLRAFLDAIRLSGHAVFVAEIPFGNDRTTHSPLYEKNIQAHRRLEGDRRKRQDQLDGWIREFEPDVVVALTDVGALHAANSFFPGPMWIDYNGHPMTERQQQAHIGQSNDSLGEAWLHVLPALLRGDRFSVCSAAQRLALVGELGASGRLNGETCGHELVEVVPPGLPFGAFAPQTKGDYMTKVGVPAGAKTILSTGGFNTWMDVDTLFRGVEQAMKMDPNLHFVCTGGRIPGHVEAVYERFERMVFNSTEAQRFHLLGWVQHEQVLEAVASADVGVNVDLATLEGELGYRNRLMGWLQGGMRVVTTVVGEPARSLVEKELARGVPFSDSEALAEALIEQARLGRWPDPRKLRQQLEEGWSPVRDLQPLVAFCEKPKVSPDRVGGKSAQNPLTELHRQFVVEQDRQQGEVSVRRFARDAGRRLLGSRLFRAAAYFNPALRDLAERLSNL